MLNAVLSVTSASPDENLLDKKYVGFLNDLVIII